jgi:glycosyltransferase involved in cell wall biosynthesis
MTESSRSGNSISVFFPAYNDAQTIGPLVSDALKVLPALTDEYEVIVVNDGSADATASVLEEVARTSPHVKVIHHERNGGYGAALRTGFKQASKDLVFYTDGDGQYNVRDLLKLYPLLTSEVDVVNGYKIRRADQTRRKLLGAVYNRFAHLFFRIPIRDVDCDFRLLRRAVVEDADLVSTGGVICVELVHKLHKAGCVFVEVPVMHYARRHGRSQFFTFRRVVRTAGDFLYLWWRLVVLPCLFRRGGSRSTTI